MTKANANTMPVSAIMPEAMEDSVAWADATDIPWL